MKTVMASRLYIRQGVLDNVHSCWHLSKAVHSNGVVPQSGCELGWGLAATAGVKGSSAFIQRQS